MKEHGTYGIYLAAGKSSRMGCQKLTLPLGDTMLGSIALQTALRSELDGVLVVTQEDDPIEWLTTDPACGTWRHLICADAGNGQAASLRCGIQAAQELQAGAVVVLLADQPFLSIEMINRLLQTFHHSQKSHHPLDYVAACHQGLPRPPILFSHTQFPQLLTLQGDEGARRLLRARSDLHGASIEYADARLFLDVDTPYDYEQLREEE